MEISNLLQILPNDLIRVPGCEPPSSVSSLKFSAYYASSNCANGLVRLQDVLDAIPGSEVVYGVNSGAFAVRQKWLKLPSKSVNCPCDDNIDYYGIMRDLPKYVDEQPEPPCEIETADFCFDCNDGKGAVNTQDSPYFPMGQNVPNLTAMSNWAQKVMGP